MSNHNNTAEIDTAKNAVDRRKIYAIMSWHTLDGEQMGIFGPFANGPNAQDLAEIGRGSSRWWTFRGCGTLEECEEFAREWEGKEAEG